MDIIIRYKQQPTTMMQWQSRSGRGAPWTCQLRQPSPVDSNTPMILAWSQRTLQRYTWWCLERPSAWSLCSKKWTHHSHEHFYADCQSHGYAHYRRWGEERITSQQDGSWQWRTTRHPHVRQKRRRSPSIVNASPFMRLLMATLHRGSEPWSHLLPA